MQLQKAMIAELDGETEKDSFPVQFNPTTLKLTLSNQVEGGDSQGRQVRQHIGPSSTTLSLDLIFDTADEGTTENPRSVRERTKQLERFLIAKGDGSQAGAPPQIRFSWGDLEVTGVVDQLTIDFDHFAANGAPLRAKVSLSIQGQDRDLELKAISDGRRGAAAPGRAGVGGLGFGFGLSAGLGLSVGLGLSASVGVALGGESAAEFAVRVGVDADAWRGLELGGESSLSLSAGVEIGFSAGLNASAGLGVTAGVESGVSSSLEASFGLEGGAGLNAVAGVGVGAELASGFALSAGGGVSAAIESVQQAKNQTAQQQSREAFKAPPKLLPAAGPALQAAATPAAQPKPPEQSRLPLKNTGLPSAFARQFVQSGPRPPRADARESSFGFGVPLRPTVGEAASARASSIQGGVAVKSKISSGEPPVTDDPTTPPWVALPALTPSRQAADKFQRKFRPARPCGCAGRCGH
jgi:Contractile injection system tube protein